MSEADAQSLGTGVPAIDRDLPTARGRLIPARGWHRPATFHSFINRSTPDAGLEPDPN
jgi:hypothetical protein